MSSPQPHLHLQLVHAYDRCDLSGALKVVCPVHLMSPPQGVRQKPRLERKRVQSQHWMSSSQPHVATLLVSRVPPHPMQALAAGIRVHDSSGLRPPPEEEFPAESPLMMKRPS
jgi:hypothetical protein